jgi:hypothetical protein
MTNAEGGSLVVSDIIQSIATEFGWPDFIPSFAPQGKVDSAVLARCVGTYGLNRNFSSAVTPWKAINS